MQTERFLKFIFFLALFTSVLTVNLYLLLSPSYVTWQYSRLTVDSGSARPDTGKALAIVDYLKHKTDRLPMLSYKERSHLADVRHVFDIGLNAFKPAFAVLIIAAALLVKSLSRRQVWRTLALCGVGGIAILTGLSWAMLLNFSWMFSHFHGLFFAGDSWIFGTDSLLIRLFPFQFWVRAGLHWALLTMSELALIAAAAVTAGRYQP
ncbi:MAG: DUF1461 domain-containing protein [Actinomycetota bacterium]|nr:DUF1461 domain-containing protein [Actinomycetota bacterium]